MIDGFDLAAFDPIFIVGAPRSGTTLLRSMLSRHPQIGLSDETYYFYSVYRRCRTFGDLADESNRKALIESYLATQRMQHLNLDLSRLKGRLMADGTSYPAFFAVILRCYAEAQGKVRSGEKTSAPCEICGHTPGLVPKKQGHPLGAGSPRRLRFSARHAVGPKGDHSQCQSLG